MYVSPSSSPRTTVQLMLLYQASTRALHHVVQVMEDQWGAVTLCQIGRAAVYGVSGTVIAVIGRDCQAGFDYVAVRARRHGIVIATIIRRGCRGLYHVMIVPALPHIQAFGRQLLTVASVAETAAKSCFRRIHGSIAPTFRACARHVSSGITSLRSGCERIAQTTVVRGCIRRGGVFGRRCGALGVQLARVMFSPPHFVLSRCSSIATRWCERQRLRFRDRRRPLPALRAEMAAYTFLATIGLSNARSTVCMCSMVRFFQPFGMLPPAPGIEC